MPNIKSAKKRMRSDARKHERNRVALSELKTLVLKLKDLESDPAKAEQHAVRIFSRYDRAVSRGIIPRGRADRKKSRIAKYLKNLKTK